jgi:hypothetical protein
MTSKGSGFEKSRSSNLRNTVSQGMDLEKVWSSSLMKSMTFPIAVCFEKGQGLECNPYLGSYAKICPENQSS